MPVPHVPLAGEPLGVGAGHEVAEPRDRSVGAFPVEQEDLRLAHVEATVDPEEPADAPLQVVRCNPLEVDRCLPPSVALASAAVGYRLMMSRATSSSRRVAPGRSPYCTSYSNACVWATGAASAAPLVRADGLAGPLVTRSPARSIAPTTPVTATSTISPMAQARRARSSRDAGDGRGNAHVALAAVAREPPKRPRSASNAMA